MQFLRIFSRPALAALVVVVALLTPAIAQADAKSDREEVQRKRAAVAAEIDTLKATDAQVEAALEALNANVAAQTAALRDAERKSAEAAAALEAATAQVAAKQAEIVELDALVRDIAIESFIRPPSTSSLIDSLASETIGEAELKQALLEAQSSNQLDVLDQLEKAREDLETARSQAEAAATEAENRKAAVASKLTSVTEARNQQAKVSEEVNARLDRRLGEAASLAELDKKLSAEIAAEQARIAKLAAQQTASRSRDLGPVAITGSGNIVSVRGIRVHKSIADQLARLLSAADADGISLSGGGYRDPNQQIALRRAHCGSSNYDVYQKPPSQCSPPTARPGQSNHERGLAVDFTYNGRAINSRSSPAFQWLKANAANYGFYNLPSEPWHWSVNGD